MKHARTKRGPGKVLALIASLTMILAGVTGVSLAGASSAAPGDPVGQGSCPTGYSYISAENVSGQSISWKDGADAAVVHSGGGVGDENFKTFYYPQAIESWVPNPSENSDALLGLSNVVWCSEDEAPSYSCPVGTDNAGDPLDSAYVEGEDPDRCNDPDPSYTCPVGTDNAGDPLDSAYVEGEDPDRCNDPDPSYTCPVGTDNAGDPLDSAYVEGEKPDRCNDPNKDKVWICHWTPGGQDEDGKYVVIPVDADDTSHDEDVQDKVLPWNDGTKPDAEDCTEVVVTDVCPGIEGNQETYPYDGSCTAPTTPPTPPQNPGSSEPAPAVVAPAVTTVPESAPAPEFVAAPAAATVPGQAPAKVTVPQAATLPAAVPAGDGSQAPELPLWALALVAVGLVGAAASAMGLLRGSK